MASSVRISTASLLLFLVCYLSSSSANGPEAGKEGRHPCGISLRLASDKAQSRPAEAGLTSAVGSEMEDPLALARRSISGRAQSLVALGCPP